MNAALDFNAAVSPGLSEGQSKVIKNIFATLKFPAVSLRRTE